MRLAGVPLKQHWFCMLYESSVFLKLKRSYFISHLGAFVKKKTFTGQQELQRAFRQNSLEALYEALWKRCSEPFARRGPFIRRLCGILLYLKQILQSIISPLYQSCTIPLNRRYSSPLLTAKRPPPTYKIPQSRRLANWFAIKLLRPRRKSTGVSLMTVGTPPREQVFCLETCL